ncbi:MAG: hypothetical protein ACRD4R_12115 [Candidatus Acidiferrales bacterium]
MRTLKYAAVIGLFVGLAGVTASTASAHVDVSVGIGIGPAAVVVGAPPVCAYGYYSDAPYACAPYGYYGPEWFASGVFIGAGPWFHGFYGPAFYGGSVFAFHDRAWLDFHEHDGWRNFHDGDRWRDYGVRGGGWQSFGGHEGYRGNASAGFHSFQGGNFHGAAAPRGGAGFQNFHGNANVRGPQGGFHGNVGNRGGNGDFHGNAASRGNGGFHGNASFHGGGARGGSHGAGHARRR